MSRPRTPPPLAASALTLDRLDASPRSRLLRAADALAASGYDVRVRQPGAEDVLLRSRRRSSQGAVGLAFTVCGSQLGALRVQLANLAPKRTDDEVRGLVRLALLGQALNPDTEDR